MKQTENPVQVDAVDMGWVEQANEALRPEGQETVRSVRVAVKDVMSPKERQSAIERAPIPLAS